MILTKDISYERILTMLWYETCNKHHTKHISIYTFSQCNVILLPFWNTVCVGVRLCSITELWNKHVHNHSRLSHISWRICDILILQCIKMLCFPVIWMLKYHLKRVGALLHVCECVILTGCSLRKLSFTIAILNNMHNRKEYIPNTYMFFLMNEWI